MNKKYTISCLFLVSFSILFAMEAPRLNPRVAAEQLLRRVQEGQDLQLDSYSIKDLQNINQYLKRESESNELAERVYWEINEEIDTRSPISAPIQEEIDRDLQDTVNEMLGKIARNREINFEDFDANRLGQIREYVRKNRHLEGANILDFQITFYLDPARLETTAHDLIAKQMRQQPLNLGQFSNQELYTLSQYLKLRIDHGEKGAINGVYTLINNYLAGESVIPIPQPTPRPITPTPGPIRPAPRPIQPVPQPPYQPLPRPQAKAPYDEGMIQFWKDWFDKGQLNLLDKPTDALLNALAGIEINNLQSKYMRLYDELKAEFERRSGAQPVIPTPRPTPPIRPPVREEEEEIPARRTVHLIDTNRLNQLGLCPLFQSLDANTQRAYGIYPFAKRCIENIAANQILMQLNTINQFDLDSIVDKDGNQLYATCPVQSLRSISLIMQYAETGRDNFLHALTNKAQATNFVEDVKAQGFAFDWLSGGALENVIQKARIPGISQEQVTVLENVTALPTKQNLMTKIRNGLREDNFVHGIVLGTQDESVVTAYEEIKKAQGDFQMLELKIAQSVRIHFFAFIIVKKGNNIQYIVVDTAPATYHLADKQLLRLKYIIDMFTTGRSNIRIGLSDAELQRLTSEEREMLETVKQGL
jgi:hypothetical protein